MKHTIKTVVLFEDTEYKKENITGYINNILQEAVVESFDIIFKQKKTKHYR